MTYAIQHRDHGAWANWISVKARDKADELWTRHCKVTHSASRLVQITDGKEIRVLFRKPLGTVG